jgi:hypothetical protein
VVHLQNYLRDGVIVQVRFGTKSLAGNAKEDVASSARGDMFDDTSSFHSFLPVNMLQSLSSQDVPGEASATASSPQASIISSPILSRVCRIEVLILPATSCCHLALVAAYSQVARSEWDCRDAALINHKCLGSQGDAPSGSHRLAPFVDCPTYSI